MVFNFDTPEKDAAIILKWAAETLKRKRLNHKIPDYLWVKFGYKSIRYNLDLLRDWQQNPDDLEAQGRARRLLADSLVSNQPAKIGRTSQPLRSMAKKQEPDGV